MYIHLFIQAPGIENAVSHRAGDFPQPVHASLTRTAVKHLTRQHLERVKQLQIIPHKQPENGRRRRPEPRAGNPLISGFCKVLNRS